MTMRELAERIMETRCMADDGSGDGTNERRRPSACYVIVRTYTVEGYDGPYDKSAYEIDTYGVFRDRGEAEAKAEELNRVIKDKYDVYRATLDEKNREIAAFNARLREQCARTGEPGAFDVYAQARRTPESPKSFLEWSGGTQWSVEEAELHK